MSAEDSIDATGFIGTGEFTEGTTTTMTTKLQRKYRQYHIDHDTILFFVETAMKIESKPEECNSFFPRTIVKPSDLLPSDAEVVAIHHDIRRDSFLLTLWHDSFDVVPDGQEIPIFGVWSSERYEVECVKTGDDLLKETANLRGKIYEEQEKNRQLQHMLDAEREKVADLESEREEFVSRHSGD